MSTNSYIGVQCEDGIYSVTCHWDGYPSHHSPILNNYYTDFMKVCELINGGDLSVLAPEIGEKHDFDDRTHSDWCLYYGRDRGDHGVDYRVFQSVASFTNSARNYGAEYAYLFIDGEWVTFKI